MLYRHILSTAVFLPLIFLSFTYGQDILWPADDMVEPPPPVKIILDPGHGGHDLGTRSLKHILEKNIILKLSKLIQQKLSHNEMLEVIIDRPDDRHITVLKRIKFANSIKGDLFIGLHADGGMGPRAHPVKIYISKYEQAKQNNIARDRHNAWAFLNHPFQKQNRALAVAIKKEMEKIGAGRDIEIEYSDKLMLGGLSMPAALIEPIDLSNPADEIRLENEVYIRKISNAIAAAVEMYLKDAGKL